MPFVDLAAQQAALGAETEKALQAAFARTDWILGEEVSSFEKEYAAYCGVQFAVGTDSGMSALELALRAFGIGPGDEVIAPANTFIATAFAISHAGATPVLVDVDPDTYTMRADVLEAAITRRTKGIIPVHLYGQPADMDAIAVAAEAHDLILLEDACQAHGARYKGRRVGSFGQAAAFSFYPTKNLGAYGDGGMIVTSDEGTAETLKTLRNYGQRQKYDHIVRGFNRRLDTLQATLLRVKLRHLDDWNEARRAHASLYDRVLADTGVVTPVCAHEVEHVWHLYVIRSGRRDELRSFLAERGIDTGIHYPVPVHLHPAYRDLARAEGAFPVAEQLATEILSLPMYPHLSRALVEQVADAVAEFSRMPSRSVERPIRAGRDRAHGGAATSAARPQDAPAASST